MVNPTKYIRQGIIQTLTAQGITTPIYEDRVPKTVKPLPEKYILMTSPSLQPTVTSKDCYEWLTTINLDVNLVNEKGYSSGIDLDDEIEDLLNAISVLQIPNFNVPKNLHRLVNMTDLPIETPTQSIQRRVLTYEFWLKRI